MQQIDEALAIYEQAREHKRLQEWHRRRAREGMAELKRFCIANHITFQLVTEANGHGQSDREEAV
ncbi:MAG TPA: hypothetical protein VGR85_08995 [Candidatus Limnocylindria bacterium]|jgi:hypothetical protein|nr:hypothetical protein [Candidatus Limnocylindria bacterium]